MMLYYYTDDCYTDLVGADDISCDGVLCDMTRVACGSVTVTACIW